MLLLGTGLLGAALSRRRSRATKNKSFPTVSVDGQG
jgi:hypothetical protein